MRGAGGVQGPALLQADGWPIVRAGCRLRFEAPMLPAAHAEGRGARRATATQRTCTTPGRQGGWGAGRRQKMGGVWGASSLQPCSPYPLYPSFNPPGRCPSRTGRHAPHTRLTGCHTGPCLRLQVAALAGRRILQVSAGGRHTLALDSGNCVLAFGNNESGQCGAPASPCQPTPRLVEGLPPGCPILFVVAGGDHSAVVVDRGGSMEAAVVGEGGPASSPADVLR